MVTEGEGAVGSVDMPTEKRKKLAIKSRTFTCSVCGMSHEALYKKWDKKKADEEECNDDNNENDSEKEELAQSSGEVEEISDQKEQQQSTIESTPVQQTEKLNPMEILRRRRASRMKQKEAETYENRSGDNQEAQQQQREEENMERNTEETHPAEGNSGPINGEDELVLAPEEIIKNGILDKIIVFIITLIIYIAVKKWVFSPTSQK